MAYKFFNKETTAHLKPYMSKEEDSQQLPLIGKFHPVKGGKLYIGTETPDRANVKDPIKVQMKHLATYGTTMPTSLGAGSSLYSPTHVDMLVQAAGKNVQKLENGDIIAAYSAKVAETPASFVSSRSKTMMYRSDPETAKASSYVSAHRADFDTLADRLTAAKEKCKELRSQAHTATELTEQGFKYYNYDKAPETPEQGQLFDPDTLEPTAEAAVEAPEKTEEAETKAPEKVEEEAVERTTMTPTEPETAEAEASVEDPSIPF